MTADARTSMQQTIGPMLDGAMPEAAMKQALLAIDLETLTAEQLAGAVDAVMARSVPFPEYAEAMDCCGTGGDGLHTLNVSTATAIVAAACGIQVVKHGNRAVSSSSGSADVLEALGVNTHLNPMQAEALLRTTGMTFLYAPTYHPSFARVAPVRRSLGQRTIFNLLGPLCNPARPQRQLIGVFAQAMCSVVAKAAVLLGRRDVTVVHGDDGADEISITTTTHCIEANGSAFDSYRIRPQDAGLPVYDADALKGGDANHNADALWALLEGAEGAYADAVALNTAMLLTMAQKARTLDEGVVLAKSVIARGVAAQKLKELIEASHG